MAAPVACGTRARETVCPRTFRRPALRGLPRLARARRHRTARVDSRRRGRRPMTSAHCRVSVVLCTYNRAVRLKAALDALLAQDTSLDYEVIVVDNNSSDDTASMVREVVGRRDDCVRYVFEGRQGLSHARNRGIDEARADIIAF